MSLLYVKSATKPLERRYLRRRTSGARQVLAVIPSCYHLLCETAKLPAHAKVERTRRGGFGGLAAMPSSQLQAIAVASILGVIL